MFILIGKIVTGLAMLAGVFWLNGAANELEALKALGFIVFCGIHLLMWELIS